MGRITIQDLTECMNQEVVSYFLVLEKELRQGAKDSFLRMKLGDRSGSVSANIWNNAPLFAETFSEGAVVKIRGMVKSYKGQTQLTVTNIREAEPTEYDIADYIATTQKDISEMGDRFFAFIDSITDEYIKQLLEKIFNEEFFPLFAKSPAAKSWHHNFVGGLLEHTVAVTTICDFAVTQYSLDRNILIAGALLHDMGKVYEYNSVTNIEFTDMGRLVGHISIADTIVTQQAATIDAFPETILMKIRHLILSHHGEMEKGAVKLPQTIEAVVLHYADNLDAQTVGVSQLIDAANKTQGDWTEYDRLNNRYFFMG